MYPKNSASPAPIQAKVVNASTGAPITADVVAYHIQGATRGAVAGTAAAHIANGLWTYAPTQAETNYDQFTIEFYHADAVGDGPIVEVKTGPAHDGASITTVTNLTNAPTNGDLTAAMKASVNAEVDTALAEYDAPTYSEMEARTLPTASYFDPTTSTVTAENVTGDVYGKVLGGGESVATGTGVRSDVRAWNGGALPTIGTSTLSTSDLDARGITTANKAQTGDNYAYLETNLGALGANATALASAAELAKVPKSDSTVTWNATALASINAQADLAISDAAIPAGVVVAIGNGSALTEAGGTGGHLTAVATQAKQDAAKTVLDTVAGDVVNIDGEAMRGTDSAYTGTPPTADAIGTDAASKILVTPSQKIVTNAGGQIEASNALTGAQMFAAVLTTQMTEAYAADGVAPTLAQAIFLIQQSLHEFAISGTTRTVKKLDGTTTAAQFTLDSATAPTSTTRSA